MAAAAATLGRRKEAAEEQEEEEEEEAAAGPSIVRVPSNKEGERRDERVLNRTPEHARPAAPGGVTFTYRAGRPSI
ncbi:hypothetical protein EYF80_057971 [Liparis tanakae]|uniref:Uncharacterized protein n=1 Tax=Liparis tanakae TaxID=230148 RepID=A0A4Z2ETH4_9TELE|nr:hypothetical protein EYF80_057971 [Liparis tanakae]